MQTFIMLVAVFCIILGLFIILFKKQRHDLTDEIAQKGENILVGPEIGTYQGGNSIVSLKTDGVIVLTDQQVIFRKPIGKDINLPLTQIVNVSKDKSFQGNYRMGKEFLILEATDTKIGFIVNDPSLWIKEISSRLSLQRKD